MRYLKTYEGLFNSFNKDEDKDETSIICDHHDIENWSINSEGLVDVDDSVYLLPSRTGLLSRLIFSKKEKLTKLPLKFGHVTGNFNCRENELESLEGAPHTVDGYFNCSGNKLESLEGGPKVVSINFVCQSNQLKSLVGAPHTVGEDFFCEDNQIKSFEGAPRSIGGKFYCESNPIHSVWKLISPDDNIWNEDHMELFNDYDCLRDDDIIIDRFNEFLRQIGRPEVDFVVGYNNI